MIIHIFVCAGTESNSNLSFKLHMWPKKDGNSIIFRFKLEKEYQIEYEIMEKKVVGTLNLHTNNRRHLFMYFLNSVDSKFYFSKPGMRSHDKKAFIWYLSDVNLRFNKNAFFYYY